MSEEYIDNHGEKAYGNGKATGNFAAKPNESKYVNINEAHE
jgi:hypothetical protein